MVCKEWAHYCRGFKLRTVGRRACHAAIVRALVLAHCAWGYVRSSRVRGVSVATASALVIAHRNAVEGLPMGPRATRKGHGWRFGATCPPDWQFVLRQVNWRSRFQNSRLRAKAMRCSGLRVRRPRPWPWPVPTQIGRSTRNWLKARFRAASAWKVALGTLQGARYRAGDDLVTTRLLLEHRAFKPLSWQRP